MPLHTFILNGKQVSVDCEDDVRLLWVLRDLLGVTGPKYGCGLAVCKACTSHINGKAFNPCSVSVSNIKPTDEIVTIEGLPATVGKDLHPMQQAWLDFDVAQCGYCQPGQIMEAVALVNDTRSAGRDDHRRRPRSDSQRVPLRDLPPYSRGDHLRSWQHVVHGQTSARRVGPRGLAAVARFVADV